MRVLLLLCGVAMPALSAFGQAPSKQGKAAPAMRIVSTAPSETEALFAMGLGDRVVGVSQFCEWPEEVKRLPKVGAYMLPDPELIVRLRPDLVVLESESVNAHERLATLGVRTVRVPHGGLAETYTGIEMMAAAAGAPERGEALVRSMRAKLAALGERSRTENTGRAAPRVLLVLDRRPGTLTGFFTVGPGSYLDELIALAGGRNVLSGPHVAPYPLISLETVLREDPDVIVDLTDAHGEDAQSSATRAKDRLLWGREGSLRAVRASAVFLPSTTAFVVPGPRTVDAASLLFDLLHPPEHRP